MSDITERLRDMACSQDALAPYDCFDDSELLVEAADEIERLRAAIERQRGAARTIMIHEAGELRELRAKRVEWHAATSTLDSEREANAILTAENERLRAAAIDVAASLAAAISLLERGGKAAKKAAPSDRMFDQMLLDYKASLERARTALRGQG